MNSILFLIFMHNIKNIERYNLNELKNNTKSNASWHTDVLFFLFSTTAPIFLWATSTTA